MQIDFHHAVTYVVSRLAGLGHDDASVVAHASQYVDDATQDGALEFTTGERYVRVTSSHKTINIALNADKADNRLVWVPFHFMPGNEAPPPGASPDDAFYYRLMCKPGSRIARDMMRDCVERKHLHFGLHRLGIALHTFVDTWAHQQFIGAVCDINKVKTYAVNPDPSYCKDVVYGALTGVKEAFERHIANFLPVGHAGALTLPDLPFLKWSFTRENGEVVARDNPTDYLKAAHAAFNVVRRFVAGDPDLAEVALPAGDAQTLDTMLRTTLYIEGERRHQVWLQAIADGAFSFGPTSLSYVEQGPGSWKMDALNQDPLDEAGVQYSFTPGFLGSNWKMFHDAVQFQRLYVLHELLPAYGICAS
ncbi:MAG: hypothetical protein JO370_01315 [Paucibacter sp.]|nr:hypothetical protein [Roseateles sp.]